MVTGTVNAYSEAIVRVLIKQGTLLHGVEAVVDTGFTEYLTLPLALIDALGLTFLRSERITQSDGESVLVRVYQATVFWDEQERIIEVQSGESEPLVGLGLMQDYLLKFPVRAGSLVTLDRLP